MARVLITGGSGGLGRALCERFAAGSWDVVATDVSGADHELDVTDADACREFAQRFLPDVWINNAGVLAAGFAADQPDRDIHSAVSVNLLGCIHGTRAALGVMRPRGRGHVVNIGSLASWVPVPGEAVYAATKAGILSFSLGLHAELRAAGESGVAITVVCPDGMLTPMLTDVIDDPHIALSFSSPKLVTAEEVAARVFDVVQRPRLVVSMPRWRGAMVRGMAGVPDYLIGVSGIFTAMGRRKQARARVTMRRGAGLGGSAR